MSEASPFAVRLSLPRFSSPSRYMAMSSCVPTRLDGCGPGPGSVKVTNGHKSDEVLVYVENMPLHPEREASHGHFGVFYALYDDVSEFRAFPEPMPSIQSPTGDRRW